MARSKSPLNITGSIKDLSFYEVEGKEGIFVRQKGGANRNHIRNSPVFDKLRKAENELRGRSIVAKGVRKTFDLWAYSIFNRHLQAAVAGVLAQIQNMESIVTTGKRSVLLSKYKEVLNQVKWYYYKPMNEILLCPYTVETSDDRKSITVTLKGLNPKFHIKAPATASHFKLFLGIGTVTDSVIFSNSLRWTRPYGQNVDTAARAESEWIAVNGPLMEDLTLTATLREGFVIKDNKTVLRALGIVFGKMMDRIEMIPRDRGSIEYLGAI
jgi:hypothetical protein